MQRIVLGIGVTCAFTFHRVVTVDVADTTRIVSGFLDEQLLLHFMPEQVLVIALSLEAEPLAPKREEWMVLESLRLVGDPRTIDAVDRILAQGVPRPRPWPMRST